MARKRVVWTLIVLPTCAMGLWLAHISAAGAAARGAKPSLATARVVVPNVVGSRMDRATRTLHNRGLRVNEECSGVFGCIVKSRWWVCQQSPRAGKRVARYAVVVIYAERRGEC
jgi:beta-lactam-binding protein with PASTA domain